MRKYVWILMLVFQEAHSQEFLGAGFQSMSYLQPFSGIGHRYQDKQVSELEPVWFESAIALPLYAKMANKKITIGAFQSLKIRMYKEPSFPVKTPDYKVEFFLEHLLFQKDSSGLFWFGRIQHFSNGQKDPLYDTLHILNTSSGSFGVNSFFAGIVLKNAKRRRIARLLVISYERVFFNFSVKEMTDFYYQQALNTLLMLDISPRFSGQTGIGIMHHNSGKVRIKAEAVLYLAPSLESDLRFFTRLYYGPDEYNSRYYYQKFSINAGISYRVNPVKLWGKK